MVEKQDIINTLREVYDPEIPINVYDLGLIYDITIKESGYVHILMSLTSPTCPTADYIKEMIHGAVSSVQGVNSVDVELTFDPLWTPDKVSDEAKEELGLELGDNNSGSNLDLGVDTLFDSNSNMGEGSNINEVVCFNCGVSDDIRPVLSCHYKGEKTNICSVCLKKFS